jgi:hypothetical protein
VNLNGILECNHLSFGAIILSTCTLHRGSPFGNQAPCNDASKISPCLIHRPLHSLEVVVRVREQVCGVLGRDSFPCQRSVAPAVFRPNLQRQ